MSFSLHNFWDRLPFAGRLLVTASLALVIAGCAMLYVSTRQHAREAQRDLRDELNAELQILPALLSELAVVGDYATLQQTLNEAVKRGNLERIRYGDASGASVESKDQQEKIQAPEWFVGWLGLRDFTAQRPVIVGGRTYGAMEVTLTPNRKINSAWTGLIQHMSVLLLAIALDFAGIWIVLHTGLQPLRALDAGSAAIGKGDFSVSIPPQGSPEFRRSIASFNEMAASLERLMEEVRLGQARLRESEKRFRALVEQAPEAILIFDPQLGCFVDANLNAEKLFGRSRDELLKEAPQNFQAAAPASGTSPPPNFEEQIGRALAGETLALEQLAHDSKGGEFFCDVRLNALPSADRRLVRMSYIDISARKRAEEEVLQLNRELEKRVEARTAALEQANAELEWFSYSVSHDLRAPLRGVLGYARVLQEDQADNLDADGASCLRKIAESAQKMERLIADLLTFSRTSRQEIEASEVDMRALVREVFEELRAEAYDRNLSLLLCEAPPARCDPALIRQVVTNLLSNAIKFTSGRDKALIEFGGRPLDAQSEYYLKDNGAGFDMQFAHKLFGAFERLHSAQEFEGTGIGLAIVKRIVERHGGRVWAEASAGAGTVFHFTLPCGGQLSQPLRS